MKCPECGAEMKQIRRGATLKKRGPAYLCPVGEAEVVKDDRGHLVTVPDAKHKFSRRVWGEGEV